VKLFILASGSKGNMAYLKTDHCRLFLDVGISYNKIIKKMEEHGEDILLIDTLLLTHEHGDHTQGLKMLLKKGNIQHLYLTQGTFDAMSEDIRVLFPQHTVIIKADVMFRINGFEIVPFMVSHDAKEPIGFVIYIEGKKIVVATDTGYIDQSYETLLSDADLYIVEANHHPTKLMHSARPFMLKKRILSERGHLSNEDACWLMNKWIKTKTSIWIVAHMSEDCNSITDIEEAIVEAFDDPTKVITYYPTQNGLPVIEL
jgi:phosphoribosyl 1,2-cyclic phosphodiesterase